MSRERGVTALFTAAIFLAAALLFVVQPMVGKMVLPRAGGSPQVWNTSMVFFQIALLAGYAYAHWSVRWLGVGRQAVVHLVVLALPILVLPMALPAGDPPVEGGQSIWILGILTLAVGAPFFALSSASPLLQRWLAETRHTAAADPYFLYAGSNAGSLVGLLAYPFLLEPLLPITVQSRLWMAGYVAFLALAAVCVAVVRYAARASGSADGRGSDRAGAAAVAAGRAVTTRDRLFWLSSAAVPSALLLGVTQYLTSEIAPISLLWVLPLAIYLATFIVAFARRRFVTPERASRALSIITVIMALALLARMVDPAWAITILHLGVLAIAALLCHGRLADRRPATSHLTEYYLFISLGGALGGTFSALVAPVVFNFIAEYPIAVAAACLFRIPFGDPESQRGPMRFLYRGRVLDVVLPALLALYLAGVVSQSRAHGLADGITVILAAVLPAIACFLFSPRTLRFALGIAVLLGAAESGQLYRGQILHEERTFFGVHRVVRDPEGNVTVLYHGSTVHGVQSTDPARAREPLGYYHPTGPAGSLVAAFAQRPEKTDIAMVGVGTGALAVLAGPQQHVTLYEIDAEVLRIAQDDGYFTYLANSPAQIEEVVGDGRISLSHTSERYDLIVLDAFSSGTIPLHLLTREAFEVYLDRLKEDGVLLFHISNRHLRLAPVLGAQARDLGLTAYEWVDVRDDESVENGIFGSEWVMLVRDPAYLEGIVPIGGWHPLPIPPDRRAWTDDFSDLLSVQRWR